MGLDIVTEAAALGVGAHLLRDFVGHKTTAMADRYARRAGARLTELRERMGASIAAKMEGETSGGHHCLISRRSEDPMREMDLGDFPHSFEADFGRWQTNPDGSMWFDRSLPLFATKLLGYALFPEDSEGRKVFGASLGMLALGNTEKLQTEKAGYDRLTPEKTILADAGFPAFRQFYGEEVLPRVRWISNNHGGHNVRQAQSF